MHVVWREGALRQRAFKMVISILKQVMSHNFLISLDIIYSNVVRWNHYIDVVKLS
jgi:hypothetical protein